MATDSIDIPSPSVFLRPSTPPPALTEARTLSHRIKPSRKPRDVQPIADPSKPKQLKSRNGCSTCKAKRLKCDEQKPGCQQCAKRKVQCGGYKKDFKWRPFEETIVKTNIERQHKGETKEPANSSRSTALTPPQPAAVSEIITSPTDEAVSTAPPEPTRSKARKICAAVSKEKSRSSATTVSPSNEVDTNAQSNVVGEEQPIIPQVIAKTPSIPPTTSPSFLQDTTVNFDSAANLMNNDKPSPTLTELLMPFGDPSPIDESFSSFSLFENLPLASPDDLTFDPLLDLAFTDEEVEEVLRNNNNNNNNNNTAAWTHSRKSSGGSYGPIDYLYSEPDFAPDSPEMLCRRFDGLTCGILSVMDGPTENPWRSLLGPLSQQSPALFHAILAMAAYHSSVDVPVLRLAGHEHKQASIKYIHEGIRDNSMTDQTAIATALALGFSESWDQHTASGNTHIKGAQVLVKRALAGHRKNPLQGEELARLKFLCNAWVYMDVIARLTAVDSDDSNDFDNAFLFSDPPVITGEHLDQTGFGIDFGMPIDARLDPLMGCAGTLFPLIGRVANLVKKVCRSSTNSPGVITQANDLKLALETWEPPAFIEPPEDPTSQIEHSLQTAEAYRWATLLHLHQSVPELPSQSSAELSQKVLTYLATVPLASRTVIVQIYPLMVAGCEASTQEDRQWVRDRWSAMNRRMRIGVINKCATVAEEVWRRRDAYEAQPMQQRKLIATADLQLPRLGNERLKRPLSGFQDAPGRNGIVFSWVDSEVGELPARPRRGTARANIGSMDPAYSVRGHLHWVGVMFDWGWEGEYMHVFSYFADKSIVLLG